MAKIIKKHWNIALISGISLTLAIIAVLTLSGMIALPGSVSAAASTSTNVSVSATVSEWITLSVSSTSLTLTPNLVDAAGNTNIGDSADDNITIGTNNSGGWSLTIQSTNGALATSTYSIATCDTTSTISAGNDMYGIQATSTTSGVSVGSYYDYWGSSPAVVGTASTTVQTMLHKDSAAAAEQVGTFKVRAACDAAQPAGTYSDTLTLTATGST